MLGNIARGGSWLWRTFLATLVDEVSKGGEFQTVYRKHSQFRPSLGKLLHVAWCGGGGGLLSKFDSVHDKYLARVCDLFGKYSCRTFSTGSRYFERMQETRSRRKGDWVGTPGCWAADVCMLAAGRIRWLVFLSIAVGGGFDNKREGENWTSFYPMGRGCTKQ